MSVTFQCVTMKNYRNAYEAIQDSGRGFIFNLRINTKSHQNALMAICAFYEIQYVIIEDIKYIKKELLYCLQYASIIVNIHRKSDFRKLQGPEYTNLTIRINNAKWLYKILCVKVKNLGVILLGNVDAQILGLINVTFNLVHLEMNTDPGVNFGEFTNLADLRIYNTTNNLVNLHKLLYNNSNLRTLYISVSMYDSKLDSQFETNRSLCEIDLRIKGEYSIPITARLDQLTHRNKFE